MLYPLAYTPCIARLPQCHTYASVNWVIIGSDNGSLPVRHQVIGLLGTNFSGIWIGILSFHSRKFIRKCHLPKWHPFCPGGNELMKTCSTHIEGEYQLHIKFYYVFQSTILHVTPHEDWFSELFSGLQMSLNWTCVTTHLHGKLTRTQK